MGNEEYLKELQTQLMFVDSLEEYESIQEMISELYQDMAIEAGEFQ